MNDEQPTQPLTDAELAQIREDYEGVDPYDSVPRLLAEVDRLRAENAAIVKLHQPTAMNSWGHRTCIECDTPGYYQEWPCPTLVALGFEEQ